MDALLHLSSIDHWKRIIERERISSTGMIIDSATTIFIFIDKTKQTNKHMSNKSMRKNIAI
jgi:hypothetical protein